MKKFIAIALTFIFIISMGVNAKAETNNNVTYYLSRQPANVQAHIIKQGVNIQVVDNIDLNFPNLATTWAYTSMYGDPVYQIDIVLEKGSEGALTHEIGHCLSNLGNIPHYYDRTPEWQAICAAESKNSIFAAQGWDDPVEYFAVAYQMYIDYPQVLAQFHPLTFQYMSAFIPSIN